MVEYFLVEIRGIITGVKLNILPLGSYNFFIGIDWLAAHREKVDYYDKMLEYLSDEGDIIMMQIIKRQITLRMIS